MFHSIANFFKGLGRLVGKAMGIVHEFISEQQLEQAKSYVLQAEDKFIDNTARREWCVKELRALGFPEWIARAGVELALRIVKQEAHKATEQVDGALDHPTPASSSI